MANAWHANFPKFGGRGAPMVVGIGCVRWAVSEFLQVVYTKPLDICYDFAAVLNLTFWLTPFWGKGAPKGSRMVLLGRAVVCSHTINWSSKRQLCALKCISCPKTTENPKKKFLHTCVFISQSICINAMTRAGTNNSFLLWPNVQWERSYTCCKVFGEVFKVAAWPLQ